MAIPEAGSLSFVFTVVESVKIKNKIAMVNVFLPAIFEGIFIIYGYVNMDMGIFIMQYMDRQYFDNV